VVCSIHSSSHPCSPSSFASPCYIFWPQVAPSGQILAQAGQPGVFWPQSLNNIQDILQLQAVEGYLLQVVLFTGFALYTIRRFRLTFGFFTIVQTFVAFSLSFLGNHPVVILIGILAGLLIDGAYAFIRPSMTHPTGFRLFAAASAATLYVVYMLSLQLMGGIAWSIHMAAGSVFVTAMVCWLLSYFVLPAQTPVECRPNTFGRIGLWQSLSYLLCTQLMR
jgi:hypothetical protein